MHTSQYASRLLACLSYSFLPLLQAANNPPRTSLERTSAVEEVYVNTAPSPTTVSESGTNDKAAASAEEGPLKDIIRYQSEDSMFFDLKNKTIYLHGANVIQYDNIKVEAEEIALNWAQHTIAARGKQNKAGGWDNKPVLTVDGVEYIAAQVRYNFESDRAVATQLFTKQEVGILRANKAKKDTRDTFYADRLSYTTCNLKHPHFHIGAQRAKIIQDDKIISGPFSLYFGNVPTPLGFFSGLMYFKTKGSGILVPGYGGESSRGFRLENLGYYFRFNDYINLTLKGAVYSKGSVNFRAESRYKRRYTYSGELSYQESMNLEPQERRLPKGEKTWRFVWNHRTESNPNSSLMACVDLQSQSYRKTMVAGEGSLNPTVNSSIRYTNKLVGILPHTLNVKLGYNKNFKRNDAKAILPELSLRTGNLYPLRTLGLSGGAWYADTYLQHSLEFKNALSNKIGEEEVDFTPENWGRIFKRGRCGVKNTFPVKTNIKLGYLNITPFLEYRERWYWEKIDYRYEPVIQDFEEDQIAGFARVYDYNFGLGANTTVYGTHVFGQENTIQAIRHQMEPKVNFTYVPDFSKPSLNYWQTVQHQGKVQKKSRFKEGVYGYPPERDKAMIQIKLSNSLEIKLRRENEEEGTTSKKVPILEGFDWSTAYDFLDKEYPLKDIQLQARTRLFDGLININANTTFDPYIYQAYHDGGRQRFRRIKEFAWIHGRGIGRVKKSALSVNTKLSSKGYQEDDTNAFMGNMQESPATTKEQRGMQVYPAQYVDFDVPWSLRLGYEWSYQSTDPAQKQINRSVLLNGNASISARWKVTFSTEYDLKKEKFVGSRTQIGVYRDLHCWEMKLTWQPLGKQKYYDFSIGVKAPILQSLKLSRSSPYSTPMPKGEE